MKRRGVLLISLFLLGLLQFILAQPTIDFISPTPTENISGNSIYVNLSTSSALEHYSFVDFDRDLILWMRMDDNNGTYVYDNSSYGNNGALQNGANIVSGKYGNALNGDGINNFIKIPDSSSLNSLSVTDKMTVCTWIKPYSNSNIFGTTQGVLGQWNTTSNQKSFSIAGGIPGVGKYAFYLSNDGSGWQDAQTNTALNLNQWTHLCATFDGTTARMYVNGTLQTDTGTTNAIYNSNADFTIGTYYYSANASLPSTLYFNGSVDEVLLFNRSLSLTEIKAIYNSSVNRFEKNYTSLVNGSHVFNAYAIDTSADFNLASRTIYTGANSSNQSNQTENQTLNITLVSSTSQTNTHLLNITTNNDSDACFISVNGANNINMTRVNSRNFYYNSLDYGIYNVSFYCNNSNSNATLGTSVEFRRYVSFYDASYINSQGLRIYFDLNFNYTSNNGKLIVMSDTWNSDKDSSTLHDAEALYLPRGYSVASVETRGKGSSQGSPDAYGYDCIDLYGVVQEILSNSTYSAYVNSSAIYLAGASGAGGRTGACTAKYPDLFSAGHSTVGVLNLTLWWQTAAQADVDSIVARVGCTPLQCPEAYQARDAGYLAYNTLTPMSVEHPVDDTRVTSNCSRNYNTSMVGFGKTITFVQPSSGGHTASWDESYSWFISYDDQLSLPLTGSLRVGGYVQTKNFSVFLDESSVNHMAYLDYDISFENKTFNLTTNSFSGNVNFTLFGLNSNTNYSVNNECYLSNSNGNLFFIIDAENYSTSVIDVVLGCIVEEPNDEPAQLSLNTPSYIIRFSADISDDNGIANVSLLGNWSGNWQIKQTNSSGLNNNTYLFTEDFASAGEGNYLWAIEVYDSAGHRTLSGNNSILVDFY